MKRLGLVFTVVLCGVLCSPVVAHAGFGVNHFDVTFTNQDGTIATQAGSHPFAMTTSFALNYDEATDTPEGWLRDFIAEQIPGFVADTTAYPRCSTADFLKLIDHVSTCPLDTQVGISAVAATNAGSWATSPLYNLTPPPGVLLRLGFTIAEAHILIDAGVKQGAPYNAVAASRNTSQLLEVFGSKIQLWGNPSDPVHDELRGHCGQTEFTVAPGSDFEIKGAGGSCPGGAPNPKPFLTLPGNCAEPLGSNYEAVSWEGLTDAGSVLTHDSEGTPEPLSGCGKLGFTPTVAAAPTTIAASSPTGLDFDLDVHDEGLTSVGGLSNSDIKKVVVALPEEMSVNPALAEGLAACSQTDLEHETLTSQPGEGCPNESKIGTVEVQTPLLEETLKGSLFLAKPYENQFGSLLALYVVVKNPETGILVKIGGKVEPDQRTGQLVSVFDDLPQLPFGHFRLSFRQGQRSPLATPPACGTYTTRADLTPWAHPESVLHDTATFQVRTGIAGGACPAGGAAPFKPSVIAGAVNNNAGAYSPFQVRIIRNDGEQEITGFSSQLPSGVTANLTGVPFCSQTQIETARAKTGAQEQTEPSCPAASEIGHTLVGVGVGSVLAYTPGKLYLSGAFEGAPFSLVSITSAKVGPFDLGTVIVHLPLQIDPLTAAVRIPAGAPDQIPHIVKGIVVHVRDIRVYEDRPNFTLNPTNCDALTLNATVMGAGENFTSPTDDTAASVNDRFQVANCANLAFKPTFKATTSGKTSRNNGANLNVTLAYPKTPLGSQTNIHSVKVSLPKQLPSRLTTLQQACTDTQFNTNPAGCPTASRVGQATAITPILPVPLTGPAYFVSHGGAKFPELIIVLQGYGVTIDLHGETFISKTGITSSTFHTVPDQPVTSFTLNLPQGKFSALAANGNLCKTKLTMPTTFTAQNGRVIKQNTKINVTNCPKAKKTKHTKKNKKK